jgi:hypothetical protein
MVMMQEALIILGRCNRPCSKPNRFMSKRQFECQDVGKLETGIPVYLHRQEGQINRLAIWYTSSEPK